MNNSKIKILTLLASLHLVAFGFGQTFTEQTGSNNPMNGVDVGARSDPFLVDIDDDGDWDLFVGENDGNINYYENTGTSTNPTFTERTGSNNPLNGVDVGSKSTPEFIDIDGDSDQDLFIGERDGTYNYYENTGTKSSPTFTLRTGSANPLDTFSVDGPGGTENNSNFTFADLDADNDYDVIAGEGDGLFHYYENIGSATSPTFTERYGSANPMDGEDVGQGSIPAFLDIDSDGDWDLLVGAFVGDLFFFENTGSDTSATYVERTGSNNPFDGVDVGFAASTSFQDLNGDGDADALLGRGDGLFSYYTGTNTGFTPLPIELIGFGVHCHGLNTLEISWKTASERKNKNFEVQCSVNGGVTYESLSIIPGAGNSNEERDYSLVLDNISGHGPIYYRLCQEDFDGYSRCYGIVAFDDQCILGAPAPRIYPNPISDAFHVSDPSASVVQLYSLTGRLLRTIEGNYGEFLLDDPNGLTNHVFIRIFDENGRHLGNDHAIIY